MTILFFCDLFSFSVLFLASNYIKLSNFVVFVITESKGFLMKCLVVWFLAGFYEIE